MNQLTKRLGPFRLSLRSQLLGLIGALLIATLSGAAVTFWYAHSTQVLFSHLEEYDLQALLAAQGLESELVVQKGLTTYYSLDQDQRWLKEIGRHHMAFETWLGKARRSNYLDKGRDILNRIESAYLRFTHSRDKVISLYARNRREEAVVLHQEVRRRFQSIYDMCEEYKRLHEERIDMAGNAYSSQAKTLTILSLAAVPVSAILALWLGIILFKQILGPIRRLADLDDGGRNDNLSGEMGALSDRMHTLLDDVEMAHQMLQQSRDQIAQSEKLAMVGKLAAGVAHSIRNPLTSVKMRLFSLERSLRLDDLQREDFDVISEEIRHLDTIIRNFLEFSRPPKLKMQRVSPSDVVDSTLALLSHRLESSEVEAVVEREDRLPDVQVDPEQLKEALMNLVLNACEAMVDGGRISIAEDVGVIEPHGRMAVIRVADNGPGIPKGMQDDIFKPFHSTKEEGTGLGLSIANRIMAEHGGWLHLQSSGPKGTTFLLALPLKEKSKWLRS
ncbi:sensor histidine kinase [Pseudodesulfovibrio tunisiensis]|uniref:sensor histidine kinase n=1 Tax=Pseudodesulfovibrio tunisiensis TaxID=463192 RepID=UPI001FB501E0|nr:ATP-binding protein [Pseudodesulfovibrio tunisiensis]